MCRPNWCILHKKFVDMGPIMTPQKRKHESNHGSQLKFWQFVYHVPQTRRLWA